MPQYIAANAGRLSNQPWHIQVNTAYHHDIGTAALASTAATALLGCVHCSSYQLLLQLNLAALHRCLHHQLPTVWQVPATHSSPHHLFMHTNLFHNSRCQVSQRKGSSKFQANMAAASRHVCAAAAIHKAEHHAGRSNQARPSWTSCRCHCHALSCDSLGSVSKLAL